MRIRSRAVLPLVALAVTTGAHAQSVPPLFESLRFRSIGPAVTGGRIHDVEALPNDPSTLYVATASGGLWKSTNKGTTWTPVFDDQPVSTFGDVAIAPSNPEVVWAGTGEQNNRQSTSWGNGVYRSVDGGRTWTHLGLAATRHIGRVVVHPRDPDVAWVAALGNLWRASEERGVYRTTDGGRTWEKVLYVDSLTGAVDLALDPSNPDVLYAATYQRLRRAWGFNGGGPGSGIHRSEDGGRSWRRLAGGLPSGDIGRIGLAVAASNPRVLSATVEHATEGGTYRSTDGGETWERVNRLNPRPMYYSQIRIDPTDEDRVYVLGVEFYRSEDGGLTFRELPTRATYDVGVHADHHALWIDPRDPEHLYLGGDGGLYESWDGGETYMRLNNIPIGQFYAIAVDHREPFHVLGGMQDNHSWIGPSATRHWAGILNDDWRQIGFGDGMAHDADPTDHRIAYSTAQNGEAQRVDTGTGDRLDIQPRPPAGEPRYRFDWVTPLVVSRHDPSVVYLGGNRLFVSRDRGESWERTEDLTRRIDRDTLSLMGVRGSEPMLSKNDGTESFGEITTIAESPLDPAILWVGTDDGNVQLSRDGGRTWAEVSGNIAGGLKASGGAVAAPPPGTYVSRVIASAAAPGRAYVTLDAHRDGDFRPYVFRTDDFGRTWTALHEGLPSGSVNVIREHPRRPELLFLGTEHALFVSLDAGRSWSRLGANLPTTLYDDLVIHPRDDALVVGTHGRSIWILDDLTPLVEWSAEVAAKPAHLFPPRPATVFQYWKDTSYRGQAAYAGENPADGVLLTYHLGRPAERATIEVSDAAGRVVRRLEAPGGAGVLHRVAWDLRHEPPPSERADDRSEEEASLPRPVGPRGPLVSPGRYTVTLAAGGARVSKPLEVRGDPLLPLTAEQHREREAFALELVTLERRAREAGERADSLRERLRARADSVAAEGGTPAALTTAVEEVTALRDRLTGGSRFGGLRRQAVSLAAEVDGRGVRQGSLHPPTATQRRRLAELAAELREIVEKLDRQEAAAAEAGPRGAPRGPDRR